MIRLPKAILLHASLLALLHLSACAGEEAGGSGSEAPQGGSAATVFREHEIRDPGLNDMVATTVLVPKGWKVEGGMTRPAAQYYAMPVLLDIKFVAPDGRQARQFPSQKFEFNHHQSAQNFSPTLGGAMYLPLPESPGSWLMEMAQVNPDPSISNLTLVSEYMEPDLTQQLRQQNAQIYQMVQQGQAMGMQTGYVTDFDTQATVIVLQYDQDGLELEETVVMTWQYLVNYWQGQLMNGNWSIGSMHSLRGPEGSDYLNDPELMAIFRSARPNPAWLQEMSRYWAELARIQNQGAAKRRQQAWAAHQKRTETLNETSDIIANGWKTRSAMNDAGHSRYIDSIHEVTPYQTPGGETVRLPTLSITTRCTSRPRIHR